MERRTIGCAQRLRGSGSGAGRMRVEEDRCHGGVEEAAARAVRSRGTAIVRLRDGRRGGLARRGVGDLRVPRRADVGVGSAESVSGCTPMRMRTPQGTPPTAYP